MTSTGEWERAINDALGAGGNLHRSLGALPSAYETTPSSGPHVPALRRQVPAALTAYSASIAELQKILPDVERELERLKSNQRRLAGTQCILRTDAGRRTLEEIVFVNRHDVKKLEKFYEQMLALIQEFDSLKRRAHTLLNR